jgi:hypothetical protein
MQGLPSFSKYLFILMVALTYGCGGSSSNDDDGDSDGDNTGNSGSDSNQATELEGTWRKSCGAIDQSDPGTFYDIVTLTFSGNGFSSSIENYTDASCSSPLPMSANPTASGTFTLGTSVSLSGGNSATQLDSHITTYNGAPFDIDDYTIYLINNSTLYLGAEDDVFDGSSPSLRSQDLDYDRAYSRQ